MTTKPNKIVKNTNKKPPNAGKGRPKGAKNKTTKALKEMILGALSDVGGQDYLAGQAKNNPNAFLSLIGKVLPQDINANVAHREMSPEEADAVVDEVVGGD